MAISTWFNSFELMASEGMMQSNVASRHDHAIDDVKTKVWLRDSVKMDIYRVR